MDKYTFEYTDTFGGEANYCWVNRGTVEAKSPKHAARLAKSELGLTGVKGDIKLNQGDDYHWTPRGSATILFISFNDDIYDNPTQNDIMREG